MQVIGFKKWVLKIAIKWHFILENYLLDIIRRASIRVAKVEKATTVTELAGIRMAATTGDKFPVSAIVNPIML